MKFEEKVQNTKLFECYGNILEKNQKEILSMYLLKDLQLIEIAENNKVTRQAIYKTLTKSLQKLENLESELGFIKKLDTIELNLNEIEKEAKKSSNNEIIELVVKTKEVL